MIEHSEYSVGTGTDCLTTKPITNQKGERPIFPYIR